MKVKLNIIKIPQDSDFSKLIPCQDKNNKNKTLSAIVGLSQPNKKMISLDKSHICDKTSPNHKLSKMLDLGLISNEKGLGPYWTKSSKEIVSRLSWLTEIDYVDLDSNSSNIWLNKTVEKSWFSTKMIKVQNRNWFKTFCQSYMSSHVESMDYEDIITVSKKIRIFPNQQQKQIFKKWLGAFRFVYNYVLNIIQKDPETQYWLNIKTKIINSLPEWSNKIPYQIKSIAIKEAIQNLREQKKQAKLKHKCFKMKYKSKKQLKQSCYIPKTAVKENGIYPRISGKLKYAEELPESVKDSRLVMTYGKFYIVIPTTRKRILSENQGRIVSIDPGIRNFMTFLSHDRLGFLARNDIGRVYRLCFYLDKLISQSTYNKKLKKPIVRLREKIHSLIEELHNKVVHFIVKNFDLILLPTFETQQMVSKSKRRVKSKSARALMTFSHYRFKQKLKFKAFEYGKLVIDVNEAFTSKTNNFTGKIDKKLGGKKFIKIGNKKLDRDLNGALGILLRALGDSPCLEE